MIATEKARTHLEALGLVQSAGILDSRLETAAQKAVSYAEFLADLLDAEVAARRERYLKARTRLADFPFQKTLSMFDFSFQPSVDERLIKELAGLSFIRETANIVLLGPPGTGKTHLAVALGVEAIANGHGAYFTTAYALVEDLRRAYEEHRLERRMRVYMAPKVLIIDEVGYLPLDPAGATADPEGARRVQQGRPASGGKNPVLACLMVSLVGRLVGIAGFIVAALTSGSTSRPREPNTRLQRPDPALCIRRHTAPPPLSRLPLDGASEAPAVRCHNDPSPGNTEPTTRIGGWSCRADEHHVLG